MPALLRKTLTYDRGNERAEHERLAERLAIRIFFADPYSPWQPGTNENTNGLLSGSDVLPSDGILIALEPYAVGR